MELILRVLDWWADKCEWMSQKVTSWFYSEPSDWE